MDKKAMYNLTYGLFILTAKEGDKDNGCIVNTVSQVTTEPNRIVVAVNKKNYTHDMIVRTNTGASRVVRMSTRQRRLFISVPKTESFTSRRRPTRFYPQRLSHPQTLAHTPSSSRT